MIDPRSAVTHQLVLPVLAFVICAGALAAVSHSIWVKAPWNTGTVPSPVQSVCPSLRVYHVPLLKVTSPASDTLTVIVTITDSESLLADVQSGRVDTIILGATTWKIASGSTEESLVLTSCTVPCCPLQVLTPTAATWTTGWALTGAGALILAFKDPANGAG